MKKNHSRAIYVWPRDGNEAPGPARKFTRTHSSVRLTDDHEAMAKALSLEFGVSYSEVFRRGLELLYNQTYNAPGTNGAKFVDPCCSE